MAEDLNTKILKNFTVNIVSTNRRFDFTCDLCKENISAQILNVKLDNDDNIYPMILNYNKIIIPNVPQLINENQYFLKSDLWICCDRCNKKVENFIHSIFSVANKQSYN